MTNCELLLVHVAQDLLLVVDIDGEGGGDGAIERLRRYRELGRPCRTNTFLDRFILNLGLCYLMRLHIALNCLELFAFSRVNYVWIDAGHAVLFYVFLSGENDLVACLCDLAVRHLTNLNMVHLAQLFGFVESVHQIITLGQA